MKNMKMMKSVVLAAALACSAAGAYATDISVPTSVSFSAASGATFNNEYDFTVTSPEILKTIFTVSSDIVGGATLYETSYLTGKTAQVSFESLTAGSSTVTTPLTAGVYFYKFIGSTTGVAGGGYTAQISTVSAVPEPASVALMIAGLGMMGFISRRRKN